MGRSLKASLGSTVRSRDWECKVNIPVGSVSDVGSPGVTDAENHCVLTYSPLPGLG